MVAVFVIPVLSRGGRYMLVTLQFGVRFVSGGSAYVRHGGVRPVFLAFHICRSYLVFTSVTLGAVAVLVIEM